MATSSTVQTGPVTRLGFDPAYLSAFEDKMYIEGPQTARRMVNFFVLLLTATVIATYGVLSNSTATVIGAMIVAPLMGPIMATTAAVVTGSLPRAMRAIALVGAGVVSVIIFAYLLSWIIPEAAISFTSNGEITSRINPGLVALLTALGAGAAGAFITSRAEIADSMGGVAIAISLVPPLCVVGISLRCGHPDAAGGALLLFMTNLLAILLAGGVVFMLVGLGKFGATREQARLRRRGILLFVAGILLVAIPLGLTAYRNVTDIQETDHATLDVRNWLQGTSYRIVSVNVNGQTVLASISGNGPLKPAGQLVSQLALTLGHPVSLDLSTLPSQIFGSQDR